MIDHPAEAAQAPAPAEPIKPALVAQIHSARADLEALLATLDEAALTAPRAGDWSIKDHLAHLSAWRRKVIGQLAGGTAWAGLGLDETAYRAADGFDALNDVLYHRDRDQSLGEVLAEFRRSHADLLAAVESAAEADLARPHNPANPDGGRVADNVIGNSYEHDAEHGGWIREYLAA